MDEATARFLTSAAGARLLDEVAVLPRDPAGRVLTLRKRGVAGEIAAGVVELADARWRARTRFPDADRGFWTRDALAQATSPAIAAYHAERLAGSFETVADLGCGAGRDALALAEAGVRVIAIERNPALLHFARANAELRGVADRITFVAGDVTALDWNADAVFWDPSRRTTSGKRVSRHGEQYEPPLAFLDAIRTRVRGGCVKLSPALPDDVLDDLNGRVEFLSERSECKEACVWFGAATGIAEMSGSAVLLPERAVFAPSAEAPPVGPTGAFVYDPDPAIVRAGALGTLADQIRARRLSADDSYLTGEAPAPQRAASSFRVWETLWFQTRRLRDVLRTRGVGRLVVKKRHFAQEPEALVRVLRLPGDGLEAVLILVRQGNGHRAILCEPVI